MKRIVIVACLVGWATAVNAFQTMVRNYNGVTITATGSASQPCGVDVQITANNYDLYNVTINYQYTGSFDSFTHSGVYDPYIHSTPPDLWTDPKRGTIGVFVGTRARDGITQTIFADPYGLYCMRPWSFSFIATVVNVSQNERDLADEKKRQEQAKIDEANRKKAAEAEHKRQLEEAQRKAQQDQRSREAKRIEDYRKASPENARCIVNSQADINDCERWKARMREEELQNKAKEMEAQRKQEEQQRQEEQRVEAQREMERRTEYAAAHPCEAAQQDLVQLRETRPQPKPLLAYPAGATAQQKAPIDRTNTMITAQNRSLTMQYDQRMAQLRIHYNELMKMCNASTSGTSSASNTSNPSGSSRTSSPTGVSTTSSKSSSTSSTNLKQELLQEALTHPNKLKSVETREKVKQNFIQSQNDQAMQDSRQSVIDAQRETQSMKNGNDELLNMINNMK
jgi:hypothetical protein